MKKQQGLTLIEIMIALALGLFIIAATLSVYVNTVKSSSNTIKSARLNHDLGMAMSLMSNDIKRAGFWGGAVMEAASIENPFTVVPAPPATTPQTDIHIFNLASPTTALTTTAGDCILYTYDANNSGFETPNDLTDDVDPNATYTTRPNEYYGFRLNTVTNANNVTVGVVQMKSGGATTTADCSGSTGWQAITDENMINITHLAFSFAAMPAQAATPTATPPLPAFPALTGTSRCLNFTTTTHTDALTCASIATGDYVAQKRVVNIRLVGQLIGADNAEVVKTFSSTVKVRNNRVFEQP